MSRLALLALAAWLGLSLAACGTREPHRAPRVAAAAVGATAGHRLAGTGCPVGRLLPAGTGAAIDYVDFLRFDGQSYDQQHVPIVAGQLGRVVTHIRCSLNAEEDQRRGPPPIIDRTASTLPVGAPVYTVHGYPARCRLAAYLGDELHVYLAQVQHGQATATSLPCALHPASSDRRG